MKVRLRPQGGKGDMVADVCGLQNCHESLVASLVFVTMIRPTKNKEDKVAG
jgi:hypothetical protein